MCAAVSRRPPWARLSKLEKHLVTALGRKRFVTPIVTRIPTLINNILLYKHFCVDISSGNITGFGDLGEASLGGKWLELLSEVAPGLKRAAIMFNPGSPAASIYMPSLETTARSLNVALITAPVHSDAEIEAAITTLARGPGGSLVVMPDAFTSAHRAPIISVAARNNVPVVYNQSAFAAEGGLLSYGPDRVDNFRGAASYVDRILRGAKPSDLPVQFPVKYEMVVNLKTAKALGLTVPQSILLRADEVIE